MVDNLLDPNASDLPASKKIRQDPFSSRYTVTIRKPDTRIPSKWSTPFENKTFLSGFRMVIQRFGVCGPKTFENRIFFSVFECSTIIFLVSVDPNYSKTGQKCPAFRCHLNTGLFADRTTFDHLNTGLVLYLDCYCVSHVQQTLPKTIQTYIKLPNIQKGAKTAQNEKDSKNIFEIFVMPLLKL